MLHLIAGVTPEAKDVRHVWMHGKDYVSAFEVYVGDDGFGFIKSWMLMDRGDLKEQIQYGWIVVEFTQSALPAERDATRRVRVRS